MRGSTITTTHSEQSGKRKRDNETTRVYGFRTFGDPGCPLDFDGPFRMNVRLLLQKFFRQESTTVWSIELDVNDSSRCRIPVIVVEESVHNAERPHCNYCRCIGWSHHFVCRSRYHFVIPGPEIGDGGNEKALKLNVLYRETHLLHGIIHSNGFGHLVRINGRERGSRYASGLEIMDLWDRICAMLRARKVSVEDVAMKRGMELRLLQCVAYGETWFARWGFKFGRGSYGVTQQTYVKSIEVIRRMPLHIMLQHLHVSFDRPVVSIVNTYQRMSGNILQTVGDLISFMMEFKARLPLGKNNSSSAAEMATPCRWSAKRIELATRVITETLRVGGVNTWIPRQEVRNAARAHIGDTGLLDFVLKSLGNRVVGCHVVRRALNPVTKVLEYSLQEAALSEAAVDAPTRDDVWRDITCLYSRVVENYGGSSNVLTAIPTAARIILDTKQLVKDYKGEMTRRVCANQWEFDDDQMLRVMCRVSLHADSALPPPELVVIPPYSTIGDLKEEAQRALRETYYVTRDFHVERIAELEGSDADLLFGVLESGACVSVEGRGIDVGSELIYEGGLDTWKVDCPCGARDDDCEKMIACDVCGVWQHTRCAGIADADSVTNLFLCKRCTLGLCRAVDSEL